MSIYYGVVDNSGPFALVKVTGTKAVVLAGNETALEGFKDGKPDSLIDKPWYFDPLTTKAYDPVVGQWIDKLGPVQTPAMRLKEERRQEKVNKLAMEKRERGRNMPESQINEIKDLLDKGVTVKYLTKKFGVSKHFINRFKASGYSKDTDSKDD